MPSRRAYDPVTVSPAISVHTLFQTISPLTMGLILDDSRSHPIIHCALGHSFSPIPAALFQVVESHLEMTMAALLIGYAVAIGIVFFASRPIFQMTANPANGVKNGKS